MDLSGRRGSLEQVLERVPGYTVGRHHRGPAAGLNDLARIDGKLRRRPDVDAGEGLAAA